MLALSTDIILEISNYLSDKEKIRLTTTCKLFNKLRHQMTYHRKIKLSKIRHLPYFNNFESVILSDETSKFPKAVKRIEISGISIQLRSLFERIPSSVTHLAFNKNFRAQINIPIPKSITHLTFNKYFDNPIVGIISSSVTYLTFGQYFNQSIKGNIPNSVTHLKFGLDFNQPIENSIPQLVTHLTFGYFFDQPIANNLPQSITHLKFGTLFNQPVANNLPQSITHLKFGTLFNQPLEGIPTSIVEIIITSFYHKAIDKQIESKIKRTFL
uniref:F-box domain-containing protein n=1 Tax=viral metagenome TaxID=1070528 RepID=A0A6C0CAG4_9ZZZZ